MLGARLRIIGNFSCSFQPCYQNYNSFLVSRSNHPSQVKNVKFDLEKLGQGRIWLHYLKAYMQVYFVRCSSNFPIFKGSMRKKQSKLCVLAFLYENVLDWNFVFELSGKLLLRSFSERYESCVLLSDLSNDIKQMAHFSCLWVENRSKP